MPIAASDFPHERERDQFGADLPHLMARRDLSDDFKNKMLCDNPVRFYPLSEGDIAAARNAKVNCRGCATTGHDQNRRKSNDS